MKQKSCKEAWNKILHCMGTWNALYCTQVSTWILSLEASFVWVSGSRTRTQKSHFQSCLLRNKDKNKQFRHQQSHIRSIFAFQLQFADCFAFILSKFPLPSLSKQSIAAQPYIFLALCLFSTTCQRHTSLQHMSA